MSDLVEWFVFAPWIEKIPKGIPRLIAIFAGYFFMLFTAVIWIPLAIIVGMQDVWKDANK